MSKKVVVFAVERLQGEDASAPPEWTTSEWTRGERRSYFENHHGEEWVASASPACFRFAGGDTSWKTVTVETPNYTELYEELGLATGTRGFRNVILNTEEAVWLMAVVLAAGASPKR